MFRLAAAGLLLGWGLGCRESAAPGAPTSIDPRGLDASGALNGCRPGEAVDATRQSKIEIRFGGTTGYFYDPACVAISPGTEVTFAGPLNAHPVAAGRVDQGLPTPDESSPIPYSRKGRSASFSVSEPGNYGYYCDNHVAEGMYGALIVR